MTMTMMVMTVMERIRSTACARLLWESESKETLKDETQARAKSCRNNTVDVQRTARLVVGADCHVPALARLNIV
jgi:hypothetical protein